MDTSTTGEKRTPVFVNENLEGRISHSVAFTNYVTQVIFFCTASVIIGGGTPGRS